MTKLTKTEQKIFKQIAKFYGCDLYFLPGHLGGTWYGKFIMMDPEGKSRSKLFTIFFHELAHFINWKTGNYPLYHNPKNFGKMRELIPNYKRLVRYSLKAEIATEKKGAQLMKEWVTDARLKYTPYYKNTKACYEFLYGYYLR